jgi:hypothetical protein
MLSKRLDMITDVLAKNYNCNHLDCSENICSREGPKSEYLESYLGNASRLLSLMKHDAKPLLVLMTDSTSSLLGRTFSQN